ncbi:MAG: hypothetical protein WD492_13020 [Alkalispirochaeta sp.]
MMNLFSRRNGYRSVDENMRPEYVSPELRVSLWNVIDIVGWGSPAQMEASVKMVWWHVLEGALDEIDDTGRAIDTIRHELLKGEWYLVFDIIELLFYESDAYRKREFERLFDVVLSRHNSAYRLVKGRIAPVTSEIEIESIEGGINSENQSIRMHFRAALDLLSDRQTPDFRNSIKESVSAIEAFCRSATGDETATLGKALKAIPRDSIPHPLLIDALSKLYGYSSNHDGIRHALKESDVEPDVDDARFWLVISTAVIGYMRSKGIG